MADIVTLAFKLIVDTASGRKDLQEFSRTIDAVGSSATKTGSILTASLTAPIVALGVAAFRTTKELDNQVNLLKAFTGSAENAEKRLSQLVNLSQKTPGLTVFLATTLDAQLRAANVTEQAINRILPAIGRLNAASPLGDSQRFAQNLIQLVTQNFERTDLKELVGQSPLAGELIKQVFNVDSPINSEAIRAAAARMGITTTDAFFTAIAKAAENNPKLAAVTESIASQFEKMVDRVSIALRPLGLTIIQTITPLVEAAVPVIQKLSEGFASLSPAARESFVVIAAGVAALGPLLLIFGGISSGIVAIVEAFTALQGVVAAGGAVATLPALLNPVTVSIAAIAAALGVAALAWATYESASDRAAKLSSNFVVSQQTQINQLEQLSREASELTRVQAGSADQHTRLQAVLAKLDPDTRTYISSITDEQTAIAELNRVLKEQIALKQGDLSKNLGDVGDASNKLVEKLQLAQQQLTNLQNQANKIAQQGGANLTDLLGEQLAGTPQQASAKELGKAVNETRTLVEGLRQSIVKYGQDVATYIAINGLSVEAFKQQQLALGRDEDQVNGMIAAFNAYQKKQTEAAGATAKSTSEIDKQRAAVDALFASLDRLNNAAHAEIDKTVRRIAESSKTIAEAKAKLQQELALNDDFFLAVENVQRVDPIIDALEKTLDPKKREAAGKQAATQQRQIASAELKSLQAQEKERELIARRDTEAARRALDDKLIDIRQFTDRAIAIDKSLLAAKLATLKQEEAEAIKAAKNQADADAKIADIRLRANTAILDSQLRQDDFERQRKQVELQAELDHQKRLADIRETNRKAEEDAVRRAAGRSTLTAEASERRLIELQNQRFDERKAQLEQEFVLAIRNKEEQRRINDELAQLAAERAAFELDAISRIQDAQAKDIAKLREFLAQRRQIIQESAALRIELLKQEADQLARAAQVFGASPDTQRAAIDAQTRAAVASSELRHQLNLERIQRDQDEAVAAANKNAALIEDIQRKSDDRRLDEEKRFQNEKNQIERQGAEESDALNPASNTSLFGVADEDITRFQAFGNAAAGALAQVSAQAGNFRTILTGALSAVGAGLQATLQAFILTGQTGPAALKKLLASVIATIAAESLVKAIFETAEGFAALARHDYASATQHFTAAKIYAAVGGIAAGVGLGIGAAGGLGGQGSGGGGGTGAASSSAPAFQEQRDLRVTRGGEGQQGESVGEGNPVFVNAINNLASSVARLDSKIEAMPPESVLATGAERRPDIIGNTAKSELRRDHDFARTIGATLGVQ
jgi:hypothetical protein